MTAYVCEIRTCLTYVCVLVYTSTVDEHVDVHIPSVEKRVSYVHVKYYSQSCVVVAGTDVRVEGIY